MIDLVTPEMRMSYAAALMQMHWHRKQVFVDRLGWELRAPGSWLEVDEFDNEYAIYMLARSDDEGLHQGSVRLLPSTRPHMLSTIFADLCPQGPLIGDDIWEISRLVTNPGGARGVTVLRVHRMLALALVEFARLNGIRRYTLVAESHRVPALLSVGWRVKPISLPVEINGASVQALQILIEGDTLAQMRARLGIAGTVLRDAEQRRAA